LDYKVFEGNADKKENKMSKEIRDIDDNTPEEEMSVELELDDGSVVNCAVITILEVDKKDYIVLLPLDDKGENADGEVWFYRYEEDENDTSKEPVLTYIEDDDEYEAVADAFDEFLDNEAFMLDDDDDV
jgi:uncharacterized protein YrzB (UPF0473 family)